MRLAAPDALTRAAVAIVRFKKGEMMKTFKLLSIGIFFVFCSHASAAELTPGEKAALGGITPITGYKYFSGNYENSHNHPAIFAYGYKEDTKLVVTGRGFYKEFSINEWSKAVEAYKSILIVKGYEPTDK